MKKLITLLTVVMAVSVAQAASINWTVNLGAKSLKAYNDTDNYTSTVYFILATETASLFNAEQTEAEFYSVLNPKVLSSDVSASSGGTLETVSLKPVSSPLLEDDKLTAFAMLIVSEDADGNGFAKILQKNGTTYADGAPDAAQTEIKTSWTSLGNQSWNKVYSVPEPATGALALAGLALLFRRRRA